MRTHQLTRPVVASCRRGAERRSWLAAVALAITVLGASACGGEDEPAVSAPPRAAPAAESPAAPVAPSPAATVPVTDPALLARTNPANGMVDYRWTGPVPTLFNEAPMLKALVELGELPQVKERLPKDPIVIPPNEAIGKYGGTWRRVYLWDGDHAAVVTGGLQRRNGDGQSLVNEMASSWEITSGGRAVTIRLHAGINRNSPYHPAGVPNRMLLVDGW